jgi:hypothetical protein
MAAREWFNGKPRRDHLQRLVHPDGRVEEKRIRGDYTKADARRGREVVKAGGSEWVETKDGRTITYGRRD